MVTSKQGVGLALRCPRGRSEQRLLLSYDGFFVQLTPSDWPTIPQVYVKGEFVGGCDIMLSSKLGSPFTQLTPVHQDGELEKLLVKEGLAPELPPIESENK